MHQATYLGLYSQCVDLISNGADVNFADEYGFTPLFVAARLGNEEITKLLCESGANVKHRNYQGKTAINMAEEKGFQNIVTILRNAGEITGEPSKHDHEKHPENEDEAIAEGKQISKSGNSLSW